YLAPDPGYAIGTPDSATVTILDNDTPSGGGPVVTITATDPEATEPMGEEDTDSAEFTVTRIGDLAGDLTAYFTVSGTATPDVDSGLTPSGGSVVIPDGEASATITVTPYADDADEQDETVVLALYAPPAAGYALGTPATATATLADAKKGN